MSKNNQNKQNKKPISEEIAFSALRQKLITEFEADKDNIKEAFRTCFSKAETNKISYEYIYNLLGINISGSTSLPDYPSYGIDPALAEAHTGLTHTLRNTTLDGVIGQYISDFIANVCPYQTKFFSLKATNYIIRACQNLWASPDGTPVDRGSIALGLNSVLQRLTDLITDAITNSNFYGEIQQILFCYLIDQAAFILLPSNPEITGSPIRIKRLMPFSYACEYTDDGELIAVYRKYKLTLKDIKNTIPTFDFIKYEANHVDIKPSNTVELREYCYKYFDTLTQKFIWVIIVTDTNDDIYVCNFMDYNPYIIVAREIPLGGNVGRGKLFSILPLIKELERITFHEKNMREWNSNLPFEVDRLAFDTIRGIPDHISPGMCIEVSKMGGIHRLEPLDLMAIDVRRRELEDDIRRAVLGETVTQDPRATATQINQQVGQQRTFLLETQGHPQRQLVRQVVEKTFAVLKMTGVAQNDCVDFLTSTDHQYLPAGIINAINGGDVDILREFVDNLYDYFGSMSQINLRVTSQIGLSQGLEEIQKYLGLSNTLANINQLTPLLYKEDVLIPKLADMYTVDGNTLLTSKEREEIQQQQQQAMMQQQQAMEMMKQQSKQTA